MHSSMTLISTSVYANISSYVTISSPPSASAEGEEVPPPRSEEPSRLPFEPAAPRPYARGLRIFYHFSAFLSNILTLPDLTPFVREGIINIRIGRCRQTGGPFRCYLKRSNRLVVAGAVTPFYFETVQSECTALRRRSTQAYMRTYRHM